VFGIKRIELCDWNGKMHSMVEMKINKLNIERGIYEFIVKKVISMILSQPVWIVTKVMDMIFSRLEETKVINIILS
jgi:hypothetical protein